MLHEPVSFEDLAHPRVRVRKHTDSDAEEADRRDCLQGARGESPGFGLGEGLPTRLEDQLGLGRGERGAEAALDDFPPEDLRLGVLRSAFERQREGRIQDGGFDLDAMGFGARGIHRPHRGVREEQGACEVERDGLDSGHGGRGDLR